MAKFESKIKGVSSVPRPKETLIATFQEWRRCQCPPDGEINLSNETVGKALAKALFDDSYNFFEMFLDDSGVDQETQAAFRALVFEQLVKEKSLGDMPALATVITEVMENFFPPAQLIKVVEAMETTYRKQVIEEYPPGIPVQVPEIDAVDKLPQLVMGILRGGDL